MSGSSDIPRNPNIKTRYLDVTRFFNQSKVVDDQRLIRSLGKYTSSENFTQISPCQPVVCDRSKKLREDLLEISERVFEKGWISDIIVHGSFGDSTAINYSDVDLVVVIASSIQKDLKSIYKLREWVQKNLFPFMLNVDPLQHHGPFYLWENLMSTYCQKSILPLEVFRKSWSIYNKDLTFRVSSTIPNPSGSTALATLSHLCNPGSSFFSRGWNMYSMKRYLSNLMLVPAQLSSDLGMPRYKAETFEWFYQEFAGSSEAIHFASEIRELWPETPSWLANLTSKTYGMRSGTESSRIARGLYYNRKIKRTIQREIVPKISFLSNAIREKYEDADLQ